MELSAIELGLPQLNMITYRYRPTGAVEYIHKCRLPSVHVMVPGSVHVVVPG